MSIIENKVVNKDYLRKKDKFLLHVDMLEILRRGSGEVLYKSENSMLLRDKLSDIYMMTAASEEEAEIIMGLLPDNLELMVTHQEFTLNLLYKKYNFKDIMVCHNVAYTKKEPINVENYDIEVRRLTENNLKDIVKNYSSIDLADEEYIMDRIKSNTMYGAFVEGMLCGFIGTHEEGSIGLLEVLPKYKGRGIGTVLQANATNAALREGRYPYGQVKEGNLPSINLQRKLGFDISKDKVWWLFK